MAKSITMIHTAGAHVARFDALAAQLDTQIELHHVVRPDLLERAQNEGITEDVRRALLAEFGPGVTLCTCTTLGPVAEAAGAIRIDRPMMKEAASLGGHVLLVVVLKSTLAFCQDSLRESIKESGADTTFDTLFIPEVWTLFEEGDDAGFAQAIADRVTATINGHCAVVLAQASMTDAAALIASPPVLTSPRLALSAALARL